MRRPVARAPSGAMTSPAIPFFGGAGASGGAGTTADVTGGIDDGGGS
ncbi:MAG: hypothetical protein R3B36_00500 [Polyangiaceae bacterium]